jgi:hypothetical protein
MRAASVCFSPSLSLAHYIYFLEQNKTERDGKNHERKIIDTQSTSDIDFGA